MEIIKKKQRNDVHPYIPEMKELYRAGRITRREFLRTATLLGMSVASASTFLTACAPPEPAAPAATEALGRQRWKIAGSCPRVCRPGAAADPAATTGTQQPAQAALGPIEERG